MNKIIINYSSREKRYAVLKDGVVEKLVINQPKQQTTVGSIYFGLVEKVLPGMDAAFVQIGEEKSGYIQRDKLVSFIGAEEENTIKQSRSVSSYVHQGERLLVQVEKDATGTKGPRLTGIIELQGEHLIYMPNGRYVAVSKKIENEKARENWRRFGHQIKSDVEGLIFRTSCQTQSEEKIISEFMLLRQEYANLLQKAEHIRKPEKLYERNSFLEEIQEEIVKLNNSEVFVDDGKAKTILQKSTDIPIQLYNGKENIFSSFHLEHEIEKALKRIVWLENGANLIFDETEALTIIDVNTGKFSGKTALKDTVLKTNRWAAIEAARQIRLRDIGGMILIDFIDMKTEKDRKDISDLLAAELKKDERRTKLIGFTPLGILQLTRKKTKPTISESLMVKCPICEGTGSLLSPETLAFKLERELFEYRSSDYEAVLIEASISVEKVFSGEQNLAKKEIEKLTGMKIIFTTVEASMPFYEIRQFGKATDFVENKKKDN